MEGGWLERAWRVQPIATAVALLLLASLGAYVGDVRLDLQLVVLGLAMVVVGAPQLIRDPEIGRALLENRYGSAWTAPFVLSACGLIGLVLAGWLLFPALTLLAVLGMTAAHLGRNAAAAHRRGGDSLIALAYGTLPFVLPAAFEPGEVGLALAWIARQQDPSSWVESLVSLGPPLAIAWFTLAGLVAGRMLRRPGAWPPIAELVAGAILFAVAPPIAACACYVALTHGVRGLLATLEALRPDDPRAAVVILIRRASAMIGVALALAGFGLVVARFSGVASVPAFAIVPVWGFSMLALPHATLQLLDPARRRETTDFFATETPLDRVKASIRRARRRVARDRPRL